MSRLVAIADCVDNCETWNPVAADSEKTFRYIDLSSVDRELKRVSSAETLLNGSAPSRARQLVKAGDVLVSTVRPNLNGVAMVPKELDGATASTGFTVLRAKEARINRSYLFHWVKNTRFVDDMVKKATGASYPAVSDRIVRESLIPLPALPEQRRIAAILDKADALRTKRRDAIAKLDQLLQSVFLEMFGDPVTNPKGWPIHRISDLLESVKYGSSAKASLQGEVPILRMSNLTYSGEMDLTDLKYITTDQAEDKYLVQPGDILFNRTNSKELVGKTAVYEGPAPMAYAGYLVRGRVFQGHVPEYISAFLNSKWGKAILRNMCKNIVGMANINAKEFGSIELPVPPSHLQACFQRRCHTIRNQKRTLQRNADQLDVLFATLQHRAFTGTP